MKYNHSIGEPNLTLVFIVYDKKGIKEKLNVVSLVVIGKSYG
jgi:hypothetical protein